MGDGIGAQHYGNLRPQPTIQHVYRTLAFRDLAEHLQQVRYKAEEVVAPYVEGDDRRDWIDGDDICVSLSEDYTNAMGVHSVDGAAETLIISNFAGLPVAPGSGLRVGGPGKTQEEIDEAKAVLFLDECGFAGTAAQAYPASGPDALPHHEGVRLQNFGLVLVTISTPVPLRAGAQVRLALDTTRFPSSKSSPDPNTSRAKFVFAEWNPADNYIVMEDCARAYLEALDSDPKKYAHHEMDLQTSGRRSNVFYAKKVRIGERAAAGLFQTLISTMKVLVALKIIPAPLANEPIENVLADKLGFSGAPVDAALMSALIRAGILGEDMGSLVAGGAVPAGSSGGTDDLQAHSVETSGLRFVYDACTDVAKMNPPVGRVLTHHPQTMDAPENVHSYDVWLSG